MAWLNSLKAVASRYLPKTTVTELRAAWASVRRFVHTAEQTDDSSLLTQLPEVELRFKMIVELAKQERRLHSSDGGSREVRHEVFENDGSDLSGYFEFACTLAKTTPWPEFMASVLRFLVDVIVASDEYDGELLSQQEVLDAFINALGGAQREIEHPEVRLAVVRMVELLCKSANAHPEILRCIRPELARSNQNISAFITGLLDKAIHVPSTPDEYASALESFGYLLLVGTDTVRDVQVHATLVHVREHMLRQLVTICASPASSNRDTAEMLHGIRFINFLSFASPQLLPIVEESIRRVTAVFAKMLQSPKDRVFQRASSLVALCVRTSSTENVRQQLVLHSICDADAMKSVVERVFDPIPSVVPSALLCVILGLEQCPDAVLSDSLRPTAGSSGAIFRSSSAVDDIFGEFISHRSRARLQPPVESPFVSQQFDVDAAALQRSTVIVTLKDRLSSAFEQPEDITASCFLAILGILAVPSAELWNALLFDEEAPFGNAIQALTHRPDANASSRRREAEGVVNAMLVEFRAHVVQLLERHSVALCPVRVA